MDSKTTGLIHHPYRAPDGFAAVPTAVHKASTVIFADTNALHTTDWRGRSAYTYGLHGTPTTYALQERIAALEGGLNCLLVPSGLAAINLVDMALLASGDTVLLPHNAYGPGKELAKHELARWGIYHAFYDSQDAASLEAALESASDSTNRVVWLEAAGSVTMEFPDLPALLEVCRRHQAISVLDNTWGAGIAFNPFAIDRDDAGQPRGVDISVHALTKYPSGGGDILMGSVTTRDDALHLRLKTCRRHMGWGVGANDVEFLLRSLPSLALRYAEHDRSARVLARWLAQQPQIAQVLHPALPGSPGHEHWRSLCGDDGSAAGLFSVIFDARYSVAQIDAFVDALDLFKIGYSWAGPVSLVMPYGERTVRAAAAPAAGLVRFSVGLEATDDLVADLQQALSRLE
ncbi:PLP-dependent transferase [Piscinibacter sakaiensis]|uniref:PLP-dependent transferase n=1 Tax=Piscinibacter sakaiensis TaxID=1547922 RepID=UPI003AAFBA5C